MADLSLRPLAKAVGSSPQVLLYYFGSKEEMVVKALAERQTGGNFAGGRGRSFDDHDGGTGGADGEPLWRTENAVCGIVFWRGGIRAVRLGAGRMDFSGGDSGKRAVGPGGAAVAVHDDAARVGFGAGRIARRDEFAARAGDDFWAGNFFDDVRGVHRARAMVSGRAVVFGGVDFGGRAGGRMARDGRGDQRQQTSSAGAGRGLRADLLRKTG